MIANSASDDENLLRGGADKQFVPVPRLESVYRDVRGWTKEARAGREKVKRRTGETVRKSRRGRERNKNRAGTRSWMRC